MTTCSIADDEVLARRYRARHDPQMVRAFRWLARVVERHHPVSIEGIERLPAGPALLVGNHGHLGYETLLFFHALLRSTGRLPRGLADRWFFRVPVVRDVLVRVGGAYGHPDNAHRLLGEGHLVVCYPGGAREVLKRADCDRYRLRWQKSRGFLRVARDAGVPIVPFAAAGVDDTFDVVGARAGTGKVLMGHDKYDLPRLSGANLGLPRPVPFLFRIGEPVDPVRLLEDERDENALDRAHQQVWRSAQRLLDDTVASWRHARTSEAHP
jgi:1-acyl-sn-glycerol-3-phosphate acyltransferase